MTQQTDHQKPVVLVVEDDDLVRLLALDLLEEHGFATEEANCAEAAIELLESRSGIDLIFTDIQMPGAFDGMELLRRAHDRWPGIRLIVTSGRKRPSHNEIPDEGRFIAKPYRPSELLAQVNDLLQAA